MLLFTAIYTKRISSSTKLSALLKRKNIEQTQEQLLFKTIIMWC